MSETSELLRKFCHRKIGLLLDDSQDTARAVLVSKAYEISVETLNELIRLTGGLVFVAVGEERADLFDFPPMVRPEVNTAPERNFVSVEAREGISTGISAFDRAVTVSLLGDPTPVRRKLVQPGHVFLLRAHDGGVLARPSLPEGALDIVKLSGGTDAAVFLDLLDAHGRFPDEVSVQRIAERNNLPLFRMSEIVRHRLETEPLVSLVAEAKLPTRLAGELRSYAFKSTIHEGEHLALVKGKVGPEEAVLTRVQPESTLSDVFGGGIPPSRDQIEAALRAIGERGRGVLVYLRRPETGHLREQTLLHGDTPPQSPPMMREYGIGAQILNVLGVRKIDLLTDSPRKLVGLPFFGLSIVSQTPLLSWKPQ